MREEIIVETCEEERRENGMFYNLITHRKSTVFSKRFLIAISFSIFRKNLKKTTKKTLTSEAPNLTNNFWKKLYFSIV
jgi:hypothetical protein